MIANERTLNGDATRRFGASLDLIAALPHLAVLLIAIGFFTIVLPGFRPYAWVDDWIYATPLHFSSASEWFSWIFAQHVDHRIPFQKATNFLILKAAGFDYRWLVAVNFVMACAVASMLLDIVKRFRGNASIGDLAIPLIVLNFCMGFTQWGFHFQFLSSMFFFTCFLYATLTGVQQGRNRLIGVGGVFLAVTTLTGMNGTLVATGAALLVIVWSFTSSGRRGSFLMPYCVTLLMGFAVLVNWTPFGAGGHPGVLAMLDYACGLLTGSFVMLSEGHETLKKAAAAILVLSAVVLVLRAMLRGRAKNAELLLGATLGIYLCLALTIAYGRSVAQGGWGYGSAMHYGILTIYFPIISWAILSSALPQKISETLGIFFLVSSVACFVVNYQSRIAQMAYVAQQEKALRDLQSDKPVEQIVRDNLMQFLVDEPSIPQAVNGINAFREAGARLYGGGRK